MVKKTKRKTYDWEVIEKDYRAGVLSIREIAKVYGCTDGAIRKKAKVCGWERDLSQKVAEKVRTDLVRTEVRTGVRTLDKITEKEIVEQAAATQVQIVRSHRRSITKASSAVNKLLDQLAESSEDIDGIEGEIERTTAEDANPSRKNQMLKAVSLQSRSSVALSLSTTLKNLIILERQAFNIADKTEDEAWSYNLVPPKKPSDN